VLEANARAIISAPIIAHVAVVDEAGLPHVTPVWADINPAGEIIINTALGRKKDRLLPVGAKVAFSATLVDNPYGFIMVRGHVADRRLEGADAEMDVLAKKYMNVDVYPMRNAAETRVTIVIEPEEVVVSG
jgi:predicted pyridoxine 5'-phosphate oxidase superfamily flavin-nucleotide-binding protein